MTMVDRYDGAFGYCASNASADKIAQVQGRRRRMLTEVKVRKRVRSPRARESRFYECNERIITYIRYDNICGRVTWRKGGAKGEYIISAHLCLLVIWSSGQPQCRFHDTAISRPRLPMELENHLQREGRGGRENFLPEISGMKMKPPVANKSEPHPLFLSDDILRPRSRYQGRR